jgi:ribosome recycling factor
MPLTLQNVLADADLKMKKTIERMDSDLATVRTGRASTAILDSVRVSYYGSSVPINQVGNMAVTEGRTIEIRPWDVSVLPDLEKAILNANLGVTPNSDGKILRLVFPALTEERRKELVKIVKKIAEDFRISLRNERREALEKIKQMEKDKSISQDVRKQNEEKIQGMTNGHIKKIDEILAAKEKEILEI